jgi:hypothetical protein
MNSNNLWVRLLIVVIIIFLIGILLWLFRCQCCCRKVIPPTGYSNNVSSITVNPNHVEGGKYPHWETPKGEEPSNDGPMYHVPSAPVRGSLSPTNNSFKLMGIKNNSNQYSGGGAGADPVVFKQYDQFGKLIGSFGIPPDPSGARGGNVILYTYNTKAVLSKDGGTNYAIIDPSTIFPSVPTKDAAGNWLDGGLCCDQVIQYVPSIDRFIWLMQFCGAATNTGGSCLSGVNRVRIASASPQNIINSNGTSWTYWDLLSSTFSLGTATMDYPDLSVGDNNLYFSIDDVGANGNFVARMPLSAIQNSQSLNIDFTSPSDGNTSYGAHLSQNTGNEIFWAGHPKNNTLRVFSLKEGESKYYQHDVDIDSWPNGTISSTAVDGKTDWLNYIGTVFPGNAVIGAARTGNDVWFAWTASAGSGFPQAHIQMVDVDVSNYSKKQQVQIWNPDFAFAFPALSTNSAGELGMSLLWGGNKNWGNNAVGIWGDFIVWYPELSDTAITRAGDYLACRRASPNATLWDAAGYAVKKSSGSSLKYIFDVYYIQFGRNSNVNGGGGSPIK